MAHDGRRANCPPNCPRLPIPLPITGRAAMGFGGLAVVKWSICPGGPSDAARMQIGPI